MAVIQVRHHLSVNTPFWEMLMACSEAEGECKGRIQGSPPLPSLLQHTPRETPNQMPAPQDEKIGLSYRKTGGMSQSSVYAPR